MDQEENLEEEEVEQQLNIGSSIVLTRHGYAWAMAILPLQAAREFDMG